MKGESVCWNAVDRQYPSLITGTGGKFELRVAEESRALLAIIKVSGLSEQGKPHNLP